jgi:hypothetical protein
MTQQVFARRGRGKTVPVRLLICSIQDRTTTFCGTPAYLRTTALWLSVCLSISRCRFLLFEVLTGLQPQRLFRRSRTARSWTGGVWATCSTRWLRGWYELRCRHKRGR